MEFNNTLYFLLNANAEESQEILEDYANDIIRSGCFDKHTLSLYCGENCSRVWIDEKITEFNTLEFYEEAAELLVDSYFITKTAALEIMKRAIEETKGNLHTQIILLKTCGG